MGGVCLRPHLRSSCFQKRPNQQTHPAGCGMAALGWGQREEQGLALRTVLEAGTGVPVRTRCPTLVFSLRRRPESSTSLCGSDDPGLDQLALRLLLNLWLSAKPLYLPPQRHLQAGRALQPDDPLTFLMR